MDVLEAGQWLAGTEAELNSGTERMENWPLDAVGDRISPGPFRRQKPHSDLNRKSSLSRLINYNRG